MPRAPAKGVAEVSEISGAWEWRRGKEGICELRERGKESGREEEREEGGRGRERKKGRKERKEGRHEEEHTWKTICGPSLVSNSLKTIALSAARAMERRGKKGERKERGKRREKEEKEQEVQKDVWRGEVIELSVKNGKQ